MYRINIQKHDQCIFFFAFRPKGKLVFVEWKNYYEKLSNLSKLTISYFFLCHFAAQNGHLQIICFLRIAKYD